MRAVSALARIRIGRLHNSRLGASLCRHNAGRSAVVQRRRVDLSPCAHSHSFSHSGFLVGVDGLGVGLIEGHNYSSCEGKG